MTEDGARDVDTDATSGPISGAAGADRPRQRFAITGGGSPDPARLAALVVALTPLPATPSETGPPAWRHAALLEGVGGPALLAPGDLEVASPRGR